MAKLLVVFVFMLVGVMAAAAFHDEFLMDILRATSVSETKFTATSEDAYAGVISGTFVSTCNAYNFSTPGQKILISVLSTRRFAGNNTFVSDVTQYIGDLTCKPNASDVFSKQTIKGSIEYRGASRTNPGATLVQYRVDGGTYLFPDTADVSAVMHELNTNCPCGAPGWVPGRARNVTAEECQVPPVPPSASNLCKVMAGEALFGSYKFTTPTTYITSRSDTDSVIGWSNLLDTTFISTLLPENGDTNPGDCDYIKYSSCGKGITTAATVCDGCEGLECEGCIFYQLPPSMYDTCCPCLYYYANKFNVPWLKINC